MIFPKRRKTKKIRIGDVPVGGDAPVSVQSMTKTPTRNAKATLRQIEDSAKAGCEITRCAVPREEDARALKEIVRRSPIPVVADVHYDYRLALMALEAGAAGLRLNPGNIAMPTSDDIRKPLTDKLKLIVREAKARKVPIRIGVNSGSLERDILRKYGEPSPSAMVESAMRHIKLLEDLDFTDIKISLKATDVSRTVGAYRLLAKKLDRRKGANYPFHIGITEAGTAFSGTIKNAIGIGILLAEGIGDTIRVSLTDSPVEEVRVGFAILQSLGLRNIQPTVISCPTCGRLQMENMAEIAREIERRVARIKVPLSLAVMGCEVNGPGESRHADLGITFGAGCGFIFKKGRKLRKVSADEAIDEFVKEAESLASEKKTKD